MPAVWLPAAAGGTFAGVVAARAADEVFARQRAERAPAQAVLLTDTPQATSHSYRAVAKVRRTASDGSVHTGKTLVNAGKKTGSSITVWTNTQDELTTAPPTRSEAAIEAGLLKSAAALAASGIAVGIGGFARWRLDRRRIAS